MEQERPDEPIRDPFFRELRRRHPDIDIVMLPPEPPPATADADAELAAADELIRVGTQARQLWSAIAPEATDGPEVRYRFGGDAASVRPVSTLTTRRDDGYEVLVRLRHELESHGWDVRRPEGTVERLTGVLDALDVSASYAEALGVLVFTMSGPSVTVGNARAREHRVRTDPLMEIVPVSVGVTSRAWDEQHLDLAAAARQVERAGTDGFTAAVSGTASRFSKAWTRFAGDLGTDCEARADGLRAAIAEYVASDDLSFHELLALGSYLAEVR